MPHTVGQLAKRTGLSIRSLHHYDEIGLLSPSDRSTAGYRLYSDSDVDRLTQIQALRWLELPLNEVKDVLDRGAPAIREAVSQKIATLSKQIDEATDLRTRLQTLQSQLLNGQTSDSDQLLSAVQLYQRYEKHFTADDLTRFKTPSPEDAETWRRIYEEAASALARNVSPVSDEAQDIAYRFGIMTYKVSGGDMALALKAKAAYEGDEVVRRTITASTKTDPAVMTFIMQASHHVHLKILAQYLNADELSKLVFSYTLSAKWVETVVSLRTEYENGASADSDSVQSLAAKWSDELDAFTSNDFTTRAKLLDGMRTDRGLQKRWLMDDELIDFALRACASKAQS